VIAHIGGLPVEEVLVTVLPAAGALWVAITARARRRPARPPGAQRPAGGASSRAGPP
jgi:hypothetical protein